MAKRDILTIQALAIRRKPARVDRTTTTSEGRLAIRKVIKSNASTPLIKLDTTLVLENQPAETAEIKVTGKGYTDGSSTQSMGNFAKLMRPPPTPLLVKTMRDSRKVTLVSNQKED